MIPPYTPSEMRLAVFNCPLCGAYADHTWKNMFIPKSDGTTYASNSSWISACRRCSGNTFWIRGEMVSPVGGGAPLPHLEMPESVMALYNEARAVFGPSPRAAAALLRVSIEALADHFGAEGEHLSQKVSWLVAEKGLDPEIAVALHSVHFAGNHASHPGEIDFKEETSRETVLTLFEAVNQIVEELITRKAKRDKLWATFPDEDRKRALQNDLKARAKNASKASDAA